jgi:hypothetical protein
MEGSPPELFGNATFDTLQDDLVLEVMRHLVGAAEPLVLVRIAQCSRRLGRLAGSDSLWLQLCRRVYCHSALPDDAGALKRCFAERSQLPLRLALELDLAIGGLQRLVALQSSDEWLSLAAREARSTEPPMYCMAGLAPELVHVS